MQKVCKAATPYFLGWRCPCGCNLKLSAGRSDVGCRYWPQMKQWLCMLQGILLNMRSPRLCWAFFTQPVIYNRRVRKSNDLKYPREPFPCPTEWSIFSSPAVPLPTECWPPTQEGFTSSFYAVEMLIAAWFTLSRTCVALVTKYQFYHISSSWSLHSFIQ